MIAVHLSSEIEQRIADLAARTGCSKNFYIKETILEYLDELEEKYLALDRLEKPGKHWTLDEIEQGIDMSR